MDRHRARRPRAGGRDQRRTGRVGHHAHVLRGPVPAAAGGHRGGRVRVGREPGPGRRRHRAAGRRRSRGRGDHVGHRHRPGQPPCRDRHRLRRAAVGQPRGRRRRVARRPRPVAAEGPGGAGQAPRLRVAARRHRPVPRRGGRGWPPQPGARVRAPVAHVGGAHRPRPGARAPVLPLDVLDQRGPQGRVAHRPPRRDRRRHRVRGAEDRRRHGRAPDGGVVVLAVRADRRGAGPAGLVRAVRPADRLLVGPQRHRSTRPAPATSRST